MSRQSRPSSFRARTAQLAVAGAAGLATVFTIVPAAVADEVAPDTTEPTETPAPAEETPLPVDETPGAETPGATDEDPAGQKAAVAEEDPEPAAEAVAPNFGLQKFRVGVKLADGATVPEGVTTAGTTIRITITSQDPEPGEEPEVIECETDESTLDEEDDATATYCLDQGDLLKDRASAASRIAAKSGVDVDDAPYNGSYDPDEIILLYPGETARITQVSDIEGVERPKDVVTIAPCEVEEEGSFCDSESSSPFDTDVKRVLFVNDDQAVDNGGTDEGVAGDDALLPDTGGADLRLLGLGALMVGAGGTLTAGARRGTRRTGAHAG